MGLSTELISEFVKITNDNKKGRDGNTVFGTISTVSEDGKSGTVKIDGSDEATPFTTTCTVTPEDRVRLNIRNHNAIVTGNVSDRSIGVKRADGMESKIEQTASSIRLEVSDEVNKLNSSIELTANEIRSEVSDEVNKLNSSIELTANEIRSEVSDEVKGLNSKITQNANSITSVVKNQNEFSEFKQTVEGFSFMGTGGTVKIKGGDINLTGAIKFSDLTDSSSVQSQINTANTNASNALDAAESAESMASSANRTANDVDETLSDLLSTSDTTTYIDGKKIKTNSIYANKLHLGGSLSVYTSESGTTAGGTLGYDSGFNSESGIGMRGKNNDTQVVCTNLAARLSYGASSPTAQFVASSSHAAIDSNGNIDITADTHATVTGKKNVYLNAKGDGIIFQLESNSVGCFTANSFRSYPTTTNATIGVSGQRWAAVYASKVYNSSGELTTSDRDAKNSIENLPDKYIDMFDRLRPVRFKYNDGTSDRYHVGYIAQEVEEAMLSANIDSKEFGGFAREVDEDGTILCMLRYDEFDGIRDLKIKQLESRIDELEKRLANLETKEVG